MRDNGPISDHEILLKDGELLVSRTDNSGRITFVNKAFIEISGFTEDELIGSPHNLVRHPHMPKEAFADLWTTIKSGRPWEGFVKNRTKSGGHYWVRANITPFAENGAIAGFISIRSKPTRAQIAAAEQLYAEFRSGRARGHTMREGRMVATGLAARLGNARRSIAGLLTGAFALVVGLTGAAAWVALDGMAESKDSLQSAYSDTITPMGQLSAVSEGIRDNIRTIAGIALRLQAGAPPAAIADRLAAIHATSARISESWKMYVATPTTPEERQLAETFSRSRAAFLEQALTPALALAEKGDGPGLAALVEGPLTTQFTPVEKAATAITAYQLRTAKEAHRMAEERWRVRMAIALAALAVAVCAAAGLGRLLLTTIRAPLTRMEGHFDAISRGAFNLEVIDEPSAEFQRITALLRGMKAKLGYGELERQETGRRSEERRRSDLERIAGELNERVQGVVALMEVSSGSLLNNSQSLSDNAHKTMAQAGNVTTMTGQVTANVQSVSAAAQELSASVVEISRQVTHAANISRDAVQQAANTDRMVRGLAEAAQRIGEVVKLISDIASQTNLLALNATIEAARAGDAGKGFAVVAGEVKTLANQTARATGEIGQQVAAIQTETKAAVEAIRAITGTIESISEVSSAIAAAVEEQGSATAEIARSVEEAAHGTASAADNVAGVALAAEETKLMADQVYQAAEGLQSVSGQLATEVSAFIRDIRAA